MVTVLKYKRYLLRNMTEGDAYDLSPNNAYISRQLTCILFILQHNITIYTSNELFLTNFGAYISAVKTMTPWRKQCQKDDVTMHFYVG